jgi:hypothetical protein
MRNVAFCARAIRGTAVPAAAATSPAKTLEREGKYVMRLPHGILQGCKGAIRAPLYAP